MASYIYEIMRCLGLVVAGMTCAGYGSDISQMKLDTIIISRLLGMALSLGKNIVGDMTDCIRTAHVSRKT